MILKDLMNPDVITVSPSMKVGDLAQLLVSKRISGAPVMEHGDLVGVVSLYDLAEHFHPHSRRLPRETRLHFYRDLFTEPDLADFDFDGGGSSTVRDIMTPNVYSLDETASVLHAVEMMERAGIHRIVVRRPEGRIGILTSTDLIRLVPMLLSQHALP